MVDENRVTDNSIHTAQERQRVKREGLARLGQRCQSPVFVRECGCGPAVPKASLMEPAGKPVRRLETGC